jgi:hypothetical protein
MLKDRRKHKRRVVNYPAWIALDTDELQDCMVLDISEGGAKLDIKGDDNTPELFALVLSKQGSPRRACRVVWRAVNQIGVQFEKPMADENVTTLGRVQVFKL